MSVRSERKISSSLLDLTVFCSLPFALYCTGLRVGGLYFSFCYLRSKRRLCVELTSVCLCLTVGRIFTKFGIGILYKRLLRKVDFYSDLTEGHFMPRCDIEFLQEFPAFLISPFCTGRVKSRHLKTVSSCPHLCADLSGVSVWEVKQLQVSRNTNY